VIKVANNLKNLVKASTHTKQALVATSISALIHGLKANEKNKYNEIIKGALKGLGADLGGFLGWGLGDIAGSKIVRSLYADDAARIPDVDEVYKNMELGGGLAGLLGLGAGGTGGYLLADKIINRLDKNKKN
jgi:hypothetical protein